MRALRTAASGLGAALRRHRGWTRAAAIGVLVYVTIIAVTGGIDTNIGSIRFRSHETDWLLRLAALVALADLLANRAVLASLARLRGAAREAIVAAAPALVSIAIGVSALAVVLWMAARLVRALPPETPEGDMALLELYTREAAHHDLLVGPYSRFRWNHPGPAMFYLFGPLYELSGERFESLRASALLLNLACLGGTLAIIRRRGGPALLIAASVAFALHLVRAPDVLASPWNPHLLLLPLALLIVSIAAVIDGQVQLSALAVAAGSFLVQAHLGVTPAVALLMAVMFAVLGARAIRGPDRPVYRRWINVALWTALTLWMLPLAQELASANGNLSAIYKSFLDEPAPGPAARESYAAFFQTFTWFLLPGFSTAWGGLIVRSVSPVAFVVAMGTLLGLAWAANSFASRGRRFGASLAFLLMGASVVALWSVVRIQGEIFDQLTFWITILGVLSVACVAAALVEMGTGMISSPRLLRAASGTAVATLAIAVVAGTVELYNRSAARAEDPAGMRIQEAADAVDGYLSRERVGRPLVHIAQPTWGHAAGIVLLLQKSGRTVSIEPGWAFMFGRTFLPTGDEDFELVFADTARRRVLADDPRYTVIAEWPDLSIHAARLAPPPAGRSGPVS